MGTYACILAWEPDAEHVLDRVYRVTDLCTSQCSPSSCSFPRIASSSTLHQVAHQRVFEEKKFVKAFSSVFNILLVFFFLETKESREEFS